MVELIIIAVCILLNAILAVIETSFVSTSRGLLRQLEKVMPNKIHLLRRLRENPERTLSIIQIGVTMVGLVSGAVGGASVDESIGPWLTSNFGWSIETSQIVGIFVVVLPLTGMLVILGELVPKAIAMKNPLRWAIFFAPLLKVMDSILSPLVNILENSTRWIMGLIRKGFFPTMDHAPSDSITQVKPHPRSTHDEFLIKLADIESKQVEDIVLPWRQVDWIDRGDSIESVIQRSIESGHTRLPVCYDKKPIGIVNTKELMAFAAEGGIDWSLLMRPLLRVLPTESLLHTLKQMQRHRSHLVLVTNSEDQALGIITLEHIFEVIVGDIFDEDDDSLVERVLSDLAKI